MLEADFTLDSDNKTDLGNTILFTGRQLDLTGLYYFRARFYHAQLGRFISRDPLGYVDGMSLYRGYFVPRGTDPTGKSSFDEYEEPPSTPFTGTHCKIGYKCFAIAGGIFTHCGIVISVNSHGNMFTIDGTGGNQNNFDWTGHDHERFDHNINNGRYRPPGLVDYPMSYCECLRKNSVKWNALDIPRTNLGFNSNTSLGCLQKRCGLPDLGYTPQSYQKKCCTKWRTTGGQQGQCNVSCEKEVDCCETVKGW